MSINIRSYNHENDYARIGRFLTDTYRPGRYHDNWFLSRLAMGFKKLYNINRWELEIQVNDE